MTSSRTSSSSTTSVSYSANFVPPPSPYGVPGLNTLVLYCLADFVWLDSAHTYGLIPNGTQTNPSPLSWVYLNGSTPSSPPPQNHSFEPNECKKLAPILLDIQNFAGGIVNDPKTGVSLYSEGRAALYTSEALGDTSSPYFCNYLTDWKDQSILGYPTPYGNQNMNPGYSFTPSGGPPTSTQLIAADGKQYAVYSAAYYQSGTLNPAVHGSPNLRRPSSTFSLPDESMFQAMNNFVRQDWADCKSILDAATANWDGNGFGGPSYRGEYLGMYLAITRIVAPVLSQKGQALNGWTGDVLAPTAIWAKVESVAWNLWKINGNALPGSYTSANDSAGNNKDNETNIALTYPYAYTWHQRVRNVALSGMYNIQSQPGSPKGPNSIIVNGYPTPDGSAV